MRCERGFGSRLTEHRSISNQLGCRLRNHAVPTKSCAIGLPNVLATVE